MPPSRAAWAACSTRFSCRLFLRNSALLFLRRPPFQLGRGLYLERSKSLLCWDDAGRYGRVPNVVMSVSGPTLRVDLRDELIYGGIAVGVEHRTELKNIFYLFPHVPAGGNWASARDAYDYVTPALNARLGNPRDQGFDGDGFPFSTWRYERISVHAGIFDRFGPQLGFLVSRRDGS